MFGCLRWLLIGAIAVSPVTVDLRRGFAWSGASAQDIWSLNCDPVVLNYYSTGLSGRRSGSARHRQTVSRPRVSFGELASRRSGSTMVCSRKVNSTPTVVF
jgi:hypothetical protein